MALNCQDIEDIKVNGSNQQFGGYIYNVSANISSSSPSEIEISFISEDGTYSISSEDLTSETPSVIRIKNKDLSFLPVSYTTNESPRGNTLAVTYKDMSVKYLDKTLILLKGWQYKESEDAQSLDEDSLAKIIDIGTYFKSYDFGATDYDSDKFYVGLKEYTEFDIDATVQYPPKALKDGILGKGIPMTQRAVNALSPSVSEYFLRGYYGTLRDVLSSWGNDFGYTFFWNFLEDGEGKLDAVSISDGLNVQDLKALTSNIQSTYYKYITDKTVSESLEGTFEKVGAITNQYTKDASIRRGRKNFETFSFAENLFSESVELNNYIGESSEQVTLNHGLKITKVPRLSSSGLNFSKTQYDHAVFLDGVQYSQENWNNIVAAALIGEEFFFKYVYYNLALYALKEQQVDFYNDYRVAYTSGAQTLYIDNARSVSSYNSLVVDMYSKYIEEFKLVAFLEWDRGSNGRLTLKSGSHDQSQKQIATEITKEKLFKDILTNQACLAIRVKPKSITPESNQLLLRGDSWLYRAILAYGLYNDRFGFAEIDEKSLNEYSFSLGYSSINWQHEKALISDVDGISELGKLLCPKSPKNSVKEFLKDRSCGNQGLSRDTIQELIQSSSESGEGNAEKGFAILDRGISSISPEVDRGLIIYEKSVSDGDVDRIGGDDSKHSSDFWVVCNFYEDMSNLEDDLLEASGTDFGNTEESNVKIGEVKSSDVPFTREGSGPTTRTTVRKKWGDLANPKTLQNIYEYKEEDPFGLVYSYMKRNNKNFDSTQEFTKDQINELIDVYLGLSFYSFEQPSYSSSLVLSTIPDLAANWMSSGLSSFDISYGSDGVSTSITISNQRRANETLDSIKRLILDKTIHGDRPQIIPKSSNSYPTRFKNRFRQ